MEGYKKCYFLFAETKLYVTFAIKMSMVNQITRTGTVLAVDGAYVKVRVGCMSACSSCDISDKCRSAEGKTLVVTALVRNGQSLCPGDNVIVRESRGKALASVLMGYGAPLLVLLSVCAIGLACSVKEDIVACVAIVIVIIYYALLYFFRGLMSRHFMPEAVAL